ncbi:choline-sulfatase [Vallitalea longa]|uniref:Choline-sulfatase n=1 Tax=Vallitalea longa TaxID=2936439 RepID=A0A9W5YGH4_9FIRM|nr:sulfatase-like hydrolase/transferase [Vallitalea longa]GKX31494.1 choline-sulfatase [Vallitalea longa]
MNKPDILIFCSDQHAPMHSGFGGSSIVETPNLDELASEGTTFDAAYTSCPLCVPARASLLTSQLPSRTGIFTNMCAIPEDKVTFLHSIALEGYETVLCGRMHFMGKDQRHGFTKRIMTDITCDYWGAKNQMQSELKDYNKTLSMYGCLGIIGGGTSPVLEYDKAVIEAALKYLDEEHDKPQCIVIGTYAPHFSYVAPSDVYTYYKDKVQLPVTLQNKPNYSHPGVEHKRQITDKQNIKNLRAAYFGMITNMDKQIGDIRKSWKKYLDKSNRDGIFVYMSDHGDQIGERNLYGKQTFYESSARIPLIIEGNGIKRNHRVKGAISIMDIGPTLCDIVGAMAPPNINGISLHNQLRGLEDNTERSVLSEFVETINNKPVPCRMLRKGKYKLITYSSYDEFDLLFDLEDDPHELEDISKDHQDIVKEMKNIICSNWNIEEVKNMYSEKKRNHAILNKWGEKTGAIDSERWNIPKEAVLLPDEM